jgi:hypothetical protein
MRISAFDLSRKSTGVSHDGPDDRPVVSTWRLPVIEGSPEAGWDYGPAVAAFMDNLDAHIAVVKPELIGYESPLPARQDPNSKIFLPETTVRILMGLGIIIEGTCQRRGILCAERNVRTVKKFWAGHGFADKDAMKARCDQLGWPVRNADEADAMGLWALLKAEYQPDWAPRSTPLFGRRRA